MGPVMIVRYIKNEDVAQINALYDKAELEEPTLTETTLVAIEEGEVLAIFSARQECHVEWICRDDFKGHRAGQKVFVAGENMLKAGGNSRYEVGILISREKMVKVAQTAGFKTEGQMLWEKELDEIVR